MSDIQHPHSTRLPLLAPVRRLTGGRGPVVLAAILGLSSALAVGTPLALAAPLADAPGGTSDVRAILHPVEQVRDDDADTFTQGILTDASGNTIHVRVRDGDTQAFKVDDDTVFRDEDGNRKHQDDLHEGDVVIVTTNGDDDQTADLVVDGGANGFQPGGAFDVANRFDEHGRWDWRARPNDTPPFDPRRLGAISHHFYVHPVAAASGGPEPRDPNWRPYGAGTPRRFF